MATKKTSSISQGMVEIQTLTKYMSGTRPATKAEALVYLKETRKAIRICKKLMKEAGGNPMFDLIIAPAKKTLDNSEKMLKQYMKQLAV